MKQILALVAVVLWLGGCAGGPQSQRPDWLDGSDPRYPEGRYVIAVGSADSVDEAQDRARAGVAKVFESQVQEQSRDIQRAESRIEGEVTTAVNEQSVSRDIRVRSDVVLHGVQVSEQWRDPGTGRFYALATLPRSQAAMSLRQEIGRLDGATDAVMLEGGRSQDLLVRAGAVARAIALQSERADAQRLLTVADPSGRGVPPVWNLQKLGIQLDQILAGVRVRPEADSEALSRHLAAALSESGLGAGDDYAVVADMPLQDLGQRDGWYWLRSDLEVRLVVAGSGQVLGSRQWPLKVAALDRAGAQARLLNSAGQILKRDLRDTLIGFVGGDAQ